MNEETQRDHYQGIPEYAKFSTTIGDEYSPCCPIIEKHGRVFASSDVGKLATEAICQRLRREGFSADWHAVKNTVSLKTLETGGRFELLRKAWRELVAAYSRNDLKAVDSRILQCLKDAL